MSQTELAERLGVMWQQLRKYETAYNRISAGCLWQAAKALGVPISYFFEGLNGKTDAATDNLSAHAGPELLRDFESCPEEVKKVAFLLLKSMAKKPKPLP